MKKLVIVMAMFFTLGSQALECQTQIGDLEIKLELNNNNAVVTYNGHESQTEVSEVYDGHMTSLITGLGLAITLENHFGCIRNVRLISPLGDRGNFEEVNFGSCKGGSTPDDICIR